VHTTTETQRNTAQHSTAHSTHGLDDGREDAHATGVGLALVDEEDCDVELLGQARLGARVGGCGCVFGEPSRPDTHASGNGQRGTHRHRYKTQSHTPTHTQHTPTHTPTHTNAHQRTPTHQFGEVLAEFLLALRELPTPQVIDSVVW
jgi:hypothetical protein